MCKPAGSEPLVNLEERQKEYPTIWLSLLCRCSPDRKTPYYTWHSGIATLCTTCGKTERWRLQQCNTCGEYFIKDFSHPAYCVFDPECWGCLEGNKPNVIDEHTIGALQGTPSRRKIPPALTSLYKYVVSPPPSSEEIFGF